MSLAGRTIDRIIGQLNVNQDVKTILSTIDIKTLEDSAQLVNVCDQLYLPTDISSTYKITKVYNKDFDLVRFLDHIIETIPCPYEVSFDVGFMVCDSDKNYQYVDPAETKSLLYANIATIENYWKFKREMRQINSDILNAAFNNTLERRHLTRWFSPCNIVLLCFYIKRN